MLSKNINFLKISNKYDLGQQSFYIATFFLGSALPISVIFYLISIFISMNINKKNFFGDKYNQFIFVISGLLIFSNINSSLNLMYLKSNIVNIWLGLFNWIPLFLLFYSSKIYLNNPLKRKIFSKTLLAGTIPILISCILQYNFGIFGTFKTFFGLIVWYLDKIDYSDFAVSGLFSNRNYAAIWLSSILVFSIFEFKNVGSKLYKRLFIFLLIFLIIYFSIFTFSRNAIIGIILTFIIIFNRYKALIPITLTYIITNLIMISLPIDSYFQLSGNIKKFFVINYENFLNFSRIEIFSIASKLILENPIFGWGPSTFSEMYVLKGGLQSIQHTHNILLELAYNFGIPLCIILSGFVLFLLLKTTLIIYIDNPNKNLITINKCWFISSLIITVNHLFDITYYDGKISILIWILLGGLRCIIDEKNTNLDNKEVLYNETQ